MTENQGIKNSSDVELVHNLNAKYKELKSEIAKVIVGQDKIIEQIIISILSKGHCLLIGVPGLKRFLNTRICFGRGIMGVPPKGWF